MKDNTLQGTLAPEDRPFTDEEWARAKIIPPLRTWRIIIGLNEEEFCSKFGVSINTLRDWERGRAKIDDDEIIDEVTDLYLQASEEYFTKLRGKSIKQGQAVPLEEARDALYDFFAIEKRDEREASGGEHITLLGQGNFDMLVIGYTRCDGSIKIISARKANLHEHKRYFEGRHPLRR